LANLLKEGDGDGNRKIVDLAQDKDKDTIEGTAIDRFVMNGAGKVERLG
jgi:hypothetical protein